jgi:hypothetical protein
LEAIEYSIARLAHELLPHRKDGLVVANGANFLKVPYFERCGLRRCPKILDKTLYFFRGL